MPAAKMITLYSGYGSEPLGMLPILLSPYLQTEQAEAEMKELKVFYDALYDEAVKFAEQRLAGHATETFDV